jgi:hypothetical protein
MDRATIEQRALLSHIYRAWAGSEVAGLVTHLLASDHTSLRTNRRATVRTLAGEE